MCPVHNGSIARDEVKASLSSLIEREKDYKVEITHEAVKDTSDDVCARPAADLIAKAHDYKAEVMSEVFEKPAEVEQVKKTDVLCTETRHHYSKEHHISKSDN